MDIFIILIGSLNLLIIYNIILIAPLFFQGIAIIGGLWMSKVMIETILN